MIFPFSVGVEMDPKILKKARAKGMCIYANGPDLPIRAKVFDLVLFCYSLEYMKDRRRAEEEGVRVSDKSFIQIMEASKYTWKKVSSRHSSGA